MGCTYEGRKWAEPRPAMYASRETSRPSQLNGLDVRPIYPFCIDIKVANVCSKDRSRLLLALTLLYHLSFLGRSNGKIALQCRTLPVDNARVEHMTETLHISTGSFACAG